MNKKPSILHDPSRFTRDIARTDEFREERTKEYLPGANLRLAVRMGSLALHEANLSEHGNETRESAVYNLLSHLDSYADAQYDLDVLRSEEAEGIKIPFEEKEPYLKEVVAFNHAAKELVNLDPRITFNELHSFIMFLYTRQHSHELDGLDEDGRAEYLEWLSQAMKGTIEGMRHELAYEQIIGELQAQGEDLEYEETTPEEELRGVDYWLTYQGKRMKVDVKKSPHSLKKPHHVLSRAEFEDFEGGFRISNEATKRYAPLVLRDIQRVAGIKSTRAA